MLKNAGFLILLICSQLANSADFLPLYNGAMQIDLKNSIVEDHHLALAKNKKVDGRWFFEREQKVSGLLSRKLYEITTEDAYSDIANYYQRQLAALDIQVLFHCAGRACGSSNEWSNSLFRDSRLYGPDNKQYYWALAGKGSYWAVYLIERGNKRKYLYIEQVQSQNVAGLAALTLDASCKEIKASKTLQAFFADKNAAYVLLYSLVGFSAAQKSQLMAEECVVHINTLMPGLAVQAMGLGEFGRQGGVRVREDTAELVRLPLP